MAKQNNIIKQNITETLELNYMPYAMSVIVSRAIPEIDGFKPAHRKLLFTMYKMGLHSNKDRTKSTNVVGQTMKLNPHGDGAIYETLVRLTRGNDALLHPFIDSKGNFGKQYSRDMAYAASRYTEVRLGGICNEIFKDIEKDTVDFVPNYDGTLKEPVLFPTTFPNILVAANQGIAVSMASSICSFNLKEVCTATIHYIKNKDADLKKYLKAPDFSTGGELIYNPEEIENIYNTGRGSFKVRAKYRFDEKNSVIEITEIPYTTTIEVIIDKIVNLVKTGKIKEINDVRNETDISGLKIAIDIKKNADPHLIMNKLFSMTTLSDSFNCNFNLLVNGSPKVLGIKDILEVWINFRIDCIKRQVMFDLNKKREKHHLLCGLSKILLDIDKAIAIIRNTEKDSQVIPNLCEGFGIDTVQAEYISEIKLRNLNKEYLLNRIGEREALEKEIKELEYIHEHEETIKDIICNDLREISKKYGKPRRTDIIYHEDVVEISGEEFIEDYSLKLFLTKHNYFKKISLVSLRSASEQKTKEDDEIIQEIETTNKADILLFSDKCNVYKMKCYEIADCKASSLGEYLTNLLGLSDDENIIYMAATTDYAGFMLFAFENGKVAKINMSGYATKVNRKKLINAYSNKYKLVRMLFLEEDSDLILVRDKDKATLFNTSILQAISTKNSTGVLVYRLKKNSAVTAVCPAEQFLSADIEYYRTSKIPSTGHFINEIDRVGNEFLKLF